MSEDERLLNVRQAARLLGVHENTVRTWANSGRLTVALRLGPKRFRRFQPAEVARVRAAMEAMADHREEDDVPKRATDTWVGLCRHCGQHTESGTDPTETLCVSCDSAGRPT